MIASSTVKRKKGLQLYAFVIMSNHIHYIASGNHKNSLSDIVRDFKKFTSAKIKKTILEEPESRRDWMMSIFTIAGKTNPANEEFQLWKNDNHPIELYSSEVMKQKLDYLHNNPVRAGYVREPQDWIYSSASNYAGMEGVMDIELLV